MRADTKPPRGLPVEVRRAFAAKVTALSDAGLLISATTDEVVAWSKWHAIRDRALDEVLADGVSVAGRRAGDTVKHPSTTTAKTATESMTAIDRAIAARHRAADAEELATLRYIEVGDDQ